MFEMLSIIMAQTEIINSRELEGSSIPVAVSLHIMNCAGSDAWSSGARKMARANGVLS